MGQQLPDIHGMHRDTLLTGKRKMSLAVAMLALWELPLRRIPGIADVSSGVAQGGEAKSI